MEPTVLRQEQLNDVQMPLSRLAASAGAAVVGGAGSTGLGLGGGGGILSGGVLGLGGASHVPQSSSARLPPYDPTCPVSVAMSKLKSLMDHADPAAAAAAAAEEEAQAEEEQRRAEEARKTKSLAGGAAEEEKQVEQEEEEEAEENDVPLECLRYFKLLNRGSQRSLMKQLICQLQRTACTPRDSLMGLGDATPRFLMDANLSASSLGIMRELLPGYGYEEQSESNNEVDPNCFEVLFVLFLWTANSFPFILFVASFCADGGNGRLQQRGTASRKFIIRQRYHRFDLQRNHHEHEHQQHGRHPATLCADDAATRLLPCPRCP